MEGNIIKSFTPIHSTILHSAVSVHVEFYDFSRYSVSGIADEALNLTSPSEYDEKLYYVSSMHFIHFFCINETELKYSARKIHLLQKIIF